MTEPSDLNAPAEVLWLEHDVMTDDVIDEPTKSFPSLRDAVAFVMKELHPSMRHAARILTGGRSLAIDQIEQITNNPG